ncbi:hypothetical protein DVH24_007567 [Malus domestica]|uniref:Uncharacterized protein n=1 Tax=Malus domestica TaxID=3750 RepID=A0A498HMB5_MALDO|nr:hypothetical protein DVH24_007567 [Malus domestica]
MQKNWWLKGIVSAHHFSPSVLPPVYFCPDMSMMNFPSKFEGPVEKKLRETGEWVSERSFRLELVELRQKCSQVSGLWGHQAKLSTS